jgi:hypothetical protein
MDEITLDGKTYVSSKQAAKITGYAKDYVGQLCREGRVLARLVGRNWYVLESSIRDHRFGTEEKVSKDQLNSDSFTKIPEEKAAVPSWEPASYASETPSEPIPLLVPQSKVAEINVLERRNSTYSYEKPVIDPVDSRVVKEMQSAWHDWFAKTNELSVSEETLLESPTRIAPEAPNLVDYSSFDHETTPITLEKVSELIEQKEGTERESSTIEEGIEESVPIKRSFAVPVQQHPQTFSDRIGGASKEIPSRMYQPIPSEGRVIHERRVIKKNRKPNAAIQIILVFVAVIAIGVTVIGSGFADSFLQKHAINNNFLRYLVGESSFVRAMK